jgi:acyl carrier protein
MTIEQSLLSTISSVFDVEESSISLEMLLSEFENYDSFKLVELLMSLESNLNIHFSSNEVDNIHKVSDINDILIVKLQK